MSQTHNELPPTALQIDRDAHSTDRSLAASLIPNPSLRSFPEGNMDPAGVSNPVRLSAYPMTLDGDQWTMMANEEDQMRATLGLGSADDFITWNFHRPALGLDHSIDVWPAIVPNFDISSVPVPYAGWDNLIPSSVPTQDVGADEDRPFVSDYDRVQNVCEFIERWALSTSIPVFAPSMAEASRVRNWTRPSLIRANELQGDRYDVQGMDWTRLQTTRNNARKARAKLYRKNAVDPEGPMKSAKKLRSRESFFRFRSMNSAIRPFIWHYQLRNLVTATSQSDIYYAGKCQVNHTDGYRSKTVMDLSSRSSSWQQSNDVNITCISSSEELLIVGGCNGNYALTSLGSELTSGIVSGYLTHDINGLTNHVHTFDDRHSRQTKAVFCSNDSKMRILDCHTNLVADTYKYPFPINCSATSPDGRLRIVVGDSTAALLTNSETGQVLETMTNHRADVFACAWADDSIHVATSAQDSQVVIYDARRWDCPLTIIPTELSCARTLRFSPTGSGKRLLYIGEASDFVNIVDAQTFETCQSLDFFGTVGGMALTPDGSTLYVANCDTKFGGLLQYEQLPSYGHTNTNAYNESVWHSWRNNHGSPQQPPDWFDESLLDSRCGVGMTSEHRFRRGLGLEDLLI